jgi:hypothetical protein
MKCTVFRTGCAVPGVFPKLMAVAMGTLAADAMKRRRFNMEAPILRSEVC